MEIRADAPAERLDAFLAARLPDLSRSRIQALIREQFIIDIALSEGCRYFELGKSHTQSPE